jgi:mRNA-degrading endonuclease RelE of RelBE toxin-antitoxin system
MRTTINISDGILSELRELARQRRRPFREILEETLQRGLGTAQQPPRTKVRLRTHRVGIKPAYQGLSLNQLYDQLEAEDTAKR